MARNDTEGRAYVVPDRTVGFSTGILPHAQLVTLSTATTSVSWDIPATLYASASGAMCVTTAGGETLTLPAWPPYTPLPVAVSTIYHSGTSASGILALW